MVGCLVNVICAGDCGPFKLRHTNGNCGENRK